MKNRKQQTTSLLHYYFYILLSLYPLSSAEAGYQISLTPKISTSFEYTDNLFLSNDKTDDVITLFSPGVIARILGKTGEANLLYDMGYSFYERFPDNNAFRHNANLSGWYGYSRHTRLDFQNKFLMTEEPGEQIESPVEEHVAEKETVRRERESFYTDTANISFTHQFGKNDIFNAKYIYYILKNKDVTVEDKINHKPSFTLNYWLIPQKINLKAGLSYTKDEFSGTSEEPESSWEESITPSVGMIYWFIPNQIGIDTGFSYTKGKFSDMPEESDNWYENITPSIKIISDSLPYNMGIETDFSYNRGVASANGESSGVGGDFEEWSGSISLTKQFTKHFGGFLRYSHTIMDFKNSEEEDYRLFEPTIGISYMVAEDIPLSFSVGYLTRDQKESGSESEISLNGDLGKTWKFSRYGSLDMDISSGYDHSYLGTRKLGFGVFYDAKCNVKYAFSKEIQGDIYALYKRDKYTDLDNKRNDRTKEGGANLTFQINKSRFFIKLGYLYRDVSSTLEEDSYRENKLRLEITLAPPRPFRTVR